MLFQSTTRHLKSAIDAQDASLGQSLADLTRTLNLHSAGDMAARAGSKAIGIARNHPLPLALAGAGLAWLILRPQGSGSNPGMESLSRWEDEGGQVLDPAAVVDRMDETEREWLDAARAARDAARDRLLDLYERGVATAEAKAAVAADQAEALAQAFRKNLADLEAEAADRTAETRRHLWEALEQGGRMAERGFDQGRRVARDHPVATSAAGLAIGAGALALALRGRGVMKLIAPVALTAALAEAVFRLRQGPAEKAAETVKDGVDEAVDAAGSTARKAARAAAAAKKADASSQKAGPTAGTKASEGTGTAKKKKARTPGTARSKTAKAAKPGTEAAARSSGRAMKATAESDVPNGAARH